MKNVLIVIDSLACGGAEKSLISLLHSVASDKYIIDLAVVKSGGVLTKELPNWINHFEIPQNRTSLISKVLAVIYSISWRVAKAFKSSINLSQLHWILNHRIYEPIDKDYDLAIAYQQGFPTYYIIDKVKAKKKFCWINTDMLRAGFEPKYNHAYYEKADLVIAVSSILKEMLIRDRFVSHQKVKVFYDTIDRSNVISLSKEYVELPKSSFIITMVGRLAKEKNYPLALDVAQSLIEAGLNFRLLIIGDGPERKNLQNTIRDLDMGEYVHLMGYKENPYPYIDRCDIFLHTSSYEGFGLSLAEAKILKKKIVATDLPSFIEQLRDYPLGKIAKANKDDIFNCIMESLSIENSQ